MLNKNEIQIEKRRRIKEVEGKKLKGFKKITESNHHFPLFDVIGWPKEATCYDLIMHVTAYDRKFLAEKEYGDWYIDLQKDFYSSFTERELLNCFGLHGDYLRFLVNKELVLHLKGLNRYVPSPSFQPILLPTFSITYCPVAKYLNGNRIKWLGAVRVLEDTTLEAIWEFAVLRWRMAASFDDIQTGLRIYKNLPEKHPLKYK